MSIYRKIKFNLLITLFVSFLLVLIPLTSCSNKSIKENLTADNLSSAYKDSSYKCWVHNINEEDRDVYKYISELKVYNPDIENDYIFVYFLKMKKKQNHMKKNILKVDFSYGFFFNLW